MNSQVQVAAIAGSLAVMAVVFQLIRRRRLREEYAILWFLGSLGLITVSLWRDSLDWAARALGVAYPPSVLLLAAIGLGFMVAIHFSISLTRLAEQNKRIAQELALLRRRVEAAAGRGPADSFPEPE
jgi:hypothetical protein